MDTEKIESALNSAIKSLEMTHEAFGGPASEFTALHMGFHSGLVAAGVPAAISAEITSRSLLINSIPKKS